MTRLSAAILASVLLAACSSQSAQGPQPLPIAQRQPTQPNAIQRTFASVKLKAVADKTAQQSVENVFAEARGLNLTDADLDSYIDPSVTGADRQLAHRLMALMPENQRGDFVYLSNDGHLVSNNPDIVNSVQLIHEPSSPVRVARNATLRRMDYSNNCSPPDPLSSPGGPYARNVSQCGFTAGWGFVNVQCGTTQLIQNQDAGHLYFEIQGTGNGSPYGKSLVEGGLEYYSDSSVAPYLRSGYVAAYDGGNGYITMQNNSTRFACGENLAIMHGETADARWTYTEVGILPSQYDPESTWVNYGTFTLSQASWLFESAPPDFSGSGTDNAGVATPCTGCSISQVTSIAQNGLNGAGYSDDGSYFGLGADGADIHWMQVAFGEWESNCVPNTTLCTFVSGNISQYAGGPQFYPDDNTAETFANPLGYGPYETYDDIDLTAGGVPAALRRAGGAFDVPTPPPPTPKPTPTPIPKYTPCPGGVHNPACNPGGAAKPKPTASPS